MSYERKEQNRKKSKIELSKKKLFRFYAANSISKIFLIGEWESVKK